MKLVGGIKVFLIKNKKIEFNLVGVEEILEMNGMSEIMRRIIVEKVDRMMVMKNKLKIKLSDVVKEKDIKM
jgi:hypothetical protein